MGKKMKQIVEVSQSEMILFKKKLSKMEQFKGRGTELISVYIPPGTDRSAVMGQLTEEISQSSNIKSPQTRKNVQGALRKIINFLKQINFKIPENGLVVFAGNVSETEGKTDIRLFTLKPVKELKTKLYWCDSSFHLAPLKEMAAPQEVYGLVTIDKNEATIAILIGKSYDIVGKFSSNVAGKQRAGGQSAKRFEHLREEAAQEFYKKISEKVNEVFLPQEKNLKGIIIGGPGITKNYFLEKDIIDYRLKKRIIGKLDTSYTDESGIREMIQMSEEILKNTALGKERKLINRFLEELAKNDMAVFGQKQVLDVISLGKAETVLLSEKLEWPVIKFKCTSCDHEFEKIIKEKKYNPNKEKCTLCQSDKLEIVEEIDFLDFMLEKAESTGAHVEIVSIETPEGQQFLDSFDGIGAILRYK